MSSSQSSQDSFNPKKSFKTTLMGPRSVIPWYEVNKQRGASPCVIRRQFESVASHHDRLAKQEALLAQIASMPEEQRHPDAVENLRARVANRKAYLAFATATLENSIRFAIARISPNTEDGKYLRSVRPGKYKMGRVNRKWWDTLKYYSAALAEFKLAKAAAAGHSGSNEALKQLMKHSAKVIATWKRKSGREADDAEQEALLGLLEAAKKWTPCHESMARLNTYAGNKVRRRTQVRKASHCKPGTTLVKINGQRKQVARGRIDTYEDEECGGDSRHPIETEIDNVVQMDVGAAMASLSATDADLVRRRFIESESVGALAEEYGWSSGKMRRKLADLKGRLASMLAKHDDVGITREQMRARGNRLRAKLSKDG